jgi:hypothetical protein
MHYVRTRGLALAGALSVLATAGPTAAADPPQLVAPVNVTKPDLDPQRTYSAPFLLANPDNPEQVVGGYLEFRTKRCGLVRSTDGGQTWRLLDASPTLPSYPFCEANNSNIFQTPLAWGRNNTLYMAMVAWDTQDTRQKVSVQLARSTDLGDTWDTTLVRDARPTQPPNQETNRPVTVVAVDSKSGRDDIVYVTYRRSLVDQPTGSSAPPQPMVSVSTDGGRTFADPVSAVGDTFAAEALRTQAIGATTTTTTPPGVTATTTTVPPNSLAATPNQAANFGGSNSGLTVDDDGNVYLAWKSASANITPTPPSGIFLSKSTDKGKTWTATQVQPFRYENGSNFLQPYIVWSPKGGASGTLHMVTEGTTRPGISGLSTIFYLRSTDGGRTWTEPKVLPDDDPARMNGKFIPNITTAPNGRVDVAWWDTRDDPGLRANDVYYAYSTDNGTTWSKNIRITDQSIDRRLGVWANNFDQSSPPSLMSTNAYALVGWDDTRFSLNDDGKVQLADPSATLGFGAGVQDIFVSAVQFQELGGGTSPVAKLMLAGALGLLAVGIALAIASFVFKRRGGGPWSPQTSTDRSLADAG